MDNLKRVASFKAVIVMTKNDGTDPTLQDVNAALLNAKIAFAMPGDLSAPIVISLSDAPPRKESTLGIPKDVVGTAAAMDAIETSPSGDCAV